MPLTCPILALEDPSCVTGRRRLAVILLALWGLEEHHLPTAPPSPTPFPTSHPLFLPWTANLTAQNLLSSRVFPSLCRANGYSAASLPTLTLCHVVEVASPILGSPFSFSRTAQAFHVRFRGPSFPSRAKSNGEEKLQAHILI